MSERVLVVEDNVALADNVAEMLLDEGAEVTVCHDAENAESIARAKGFDLAIVDIRLAGGESGLDLVPRLRRHSVHGEIVLMTGNATLDSAIQAIRRGVYAYIPKPFEPEHLIALVKRALAQVALKRDKQGLSQRLAASEALYRGVVETVEACILGLDARGIIRFGNRFVAERVGCSQAELVGKGFAELCQHSDKRTVELAIRRALSGEPVREYECSLVPRTGRPRSVRWTLTPLDPGSLDVAQRAVEVSQVELPVVLAAGIDVTDRRELERKSAEAEAMAAMGTLTTALAHEIRNPLNAARLQLELMLRRAKRAGDPALQEALAGPAQLVRTEIDRLSSLLDEFLDLARPRQIERTTCSLRQLFEEVCKLEEPLASSARVELTTRIQPEELTVRGDPDKLKQVMINLIVNAIDALRERGSGHVELGAEQAANGSVVITVRDDGPGIAPEVADSAFTPFVTSKRGGTGLGLSVVQKIVHQHGGEAELLPGPGGGTLARFTVAP